LTDTLKFRLSLYICLAVMLVGLLVAGLLTTVDYRSDKQRDFYARGIATAEQLALATSDELLREDSFGLYKSIESQLSADSKYSNSPVEYIEVLDLSGKVLARAYTLGNSEDMALIAGSRAAAAQSSETRQVSHTLEDGSELLDVAFPVKLDGEKIGVYRVGVSDRQIREGLKKNLLYTLLVVVAACLVGVLMGVKIAGWVARPVEALAKGAEEFSLGDLDYRVDVSRPRELKVLNDSFNNMAASLKEKIENLKKAREEAEDLSRKLAVSYRDAQQGTARLQETNEWVTDLAFRLEEMNVKFKTEKSQTDTIVNSIRDGLVALDRDEKVILINHEAEDIFEVRSDEVKGKPVELLVERMADRAEDREELREKCRQADLGYEGPGFYDVTLAKPYRRILRRMSSLIRDEFGETTGRVLTFRDITKEKEVDEMKTNFISNVSHELRTPLTSIKGAINLLIEGGIDDKDTHAEFLRIAEQNTDRLVNLITNLLDLSRLEEGRMAIRFEPVDICEVVRSVIRSMDIIAKKNGLTLESRMPGEPLYAMGDKDRLDQLVVNLVGNAVKFTDPGGKVRVIVGSKGEELTIEVEDEGIGIPRDKLMKVFDRFYQVDMSATRKKGGTGLGLSICSVIAKEHGGRIWAESPISPEGKGARFSVSLPKPSSRLLEVSALREEKQIDLRLDGRLVLVVNPDQAAIAGEKNVLRREGYALASAITGHEALNIARERRPAMIFISQNLPDIEGLDVAGILRNDPATKDVPVVITASLSDEEKQRCVNLGCGNIAGPFTGNDLVIALRKACGV
jgi:two-component system, OmpR family, phosphate regulon sensor histidine kinase PhoR